MESTVACGSWFSNQVCGSWRMVRAESSAKAAHGNSRKISQVSAWERGFRKCRSLAAGRHRHIGLEHTTDARFPSLPAHTRPAGSRAPLPVSWGMNEFSDLPLHPALFHGLDALGHVQMTPVQAQRLPALLDGRDLLAQAPP